MRVANLGEQKVAKPEVLTHVVSIRRLPQGLARQTLSRPEANKKHCQADISDHIEPSQHSTATQVAEVHMRSDVLPSNPRKRLGVQLVLVVTDERLTHTLGIIQ